MLAVLALSAAKPVSRELTDPSSGYADLNWTPDTGFSALDDALNTLETQTKDFFTMILDQIDNLTSPLTNLINYIYTTVTNVFDGVAYAARDILAPLLALLAPVANILNLLGALPSLLNLLNP